MSIYITLNFLRTGISIDFPLVVTRFLFRVRGLLFSFMELNLLMR